MQLGTIRSGAREHNLIGRDIAFNMQWSGFEFRISHLFTLSGEYLATGLLH